MFRELWILIKMLFRTNPCNINNVSLMNMKHFPFKGYKYLMWCGKMIYRDDMYDRRQKEWATDLFLVDKNHEQIHLMQAKMCGSWVKYYWRYFIEWLKGNPIIAPASSAYYTTPQEMEAYANEDNFGYPEGMIIYEDNYSEGVCGKYIIKNGRKELYKKVGGTSKNWKEYVKGL